MSGSQIQNPSFGAYQGQNIAPPPIFGAAEAQGKADINLYNTNTANTNAKKAGMYNFVSNLLA
jgi:hypothetical protein